MAEPTGSGLKLCDTDTRRHHHRPESYRVCLADGPSLEKYWQETGLVGTISAVNLHYMGGWRRLNGIGPDRWLQTTVAQMQLSHVYRNAQNVWGYAHVTVWDTEKTIGRIPIWNAQQWCIKAPF